MGRVRVGAKHSGRSMAGTGHGMTVAERIYAYLRSAKKQDPKTRISDFQMRAHKDAVEIVNLKTNVSRLFRAEDDDDRW